MQIVPAGTRVVLATRNYSKVLQIKDVLEDIPGVILSSLNDLQIEGDAEEDGTTLEQKAFKKATWAYDQTGGYTLAEETGFFIDALGGRPGIHAAGWAGKKSTEEIMRYTLDQIEFVPIEGRTAKFKTVAIVISPGGKTESFKGEVSGNILLEPRCVCQPNMPYSAIFMPNGTDKVWAEMTPEEENLISQRGEALRKVREYLIKTII
jgi:XTP/dITP diphosphohydrolase